jgi:hypothetical protein
MSGEAITAAANELAQKLDADIFVFNAPMERGNDRKVITDVASRKRRRANVMLVLVTDGGDPDVAYRISRCLQFSYAEGKFLCFISGFCKSAGALLALGAHELVFSDHGEIGPIDVQMGKKDELWEWQSGLTVNAAISSLNEQAFQAFESFMVQTKYHLRGGITLRTAADVAAKLTTGLYGQIFQQFDPMHIGESGRSMLVAEKYGVRLDMRYRNLKKGTLSRLIADYPSHGFVIDRDEAAFYFHRVRPASPGEVDLEKALGDTACVPIDTSNNNQSGIIEFISTERPEETQHVADQPILGPSEEHGPGEVATPPAGNVPGNGQAPTPA